MNFDYLNNRLCPFCQVKLFRPIGFYDRYAFYECEQDKFQIWYYEDDCWYCFRINFDYDLSIVGFKESNTIQYRDLNLLHEEAFPSLPMFDVFKLSNQQILEKCKKFLVFS